MRDVSARISLTSRQVRAGFACRMRAITPAAMGAAALVASKLDMYAYPPSVVVTAGLG